MRLDRALEESVRAYPSKVAIEMYRGPSLTFEELWVRSGAVAGCLGRRGVRAGDRVGLVSGHSVEAIILFWAVLRTRAIVVWLTADSSDDDFACAIGNAEPRLVFFGKQSDVDRIVTAGASRANVVELTDFVSAADEAAEVPADIEDDKEPAAIIYTSGSSGRPKGVCLSHQNLWTVASAVCEHMPICSSDSYLMVVPLHYVHGIMQLLVHALAGATVVLYENFVFPRKIVAILQETRVTGFSGVPFHFNSLIRNGGFLEAEFPDLRWLTVTGGKLDSNTVLEILDHHPGVEFHIAYGQTECGPRATALDPDRVRGKPDSVGSAIPGVEVLLLDDQGAEVDSGESGEVVIAGSNVMMGYWNDREATARALDSKGRLLTGDVGRFDEDGDLYLLGRRSAMIKSAGERIIPEELERVVAQHEYADEVVVLGEPDPVYGQIAVAHVLRSARCSTLSDDDVAAVLREHCLTQIPYVRAPRRYYCWHEFPRKPNGKPDRTRISEHGTDDSK